MTYLPKQTLIKQISPWASKTNSEPGNTQISMIANTPEPPYYAVIFSSINTENAEDYSEMAERMVELAGQQEGFLGIESARNELGITVSYWKDLTSIKHWKENAEHSMAQVQGRKKWYQSYKTRIAKIERDYGFEKE